jgi:anamorsin
MALMIAGFVDTKEDPEVSDYPGLVNATLFTSTKQAAVAAALPLAAKTAPVTKKWTVLADDFDETADEDMIDEDSLLDDTDEVLQAAKNDCEVGKDGKRRACKDCTCG